MLLIDQYAYNQYIPNYANDQVGGGNGGGGYQQAPSYGSSNAPPAANSYSQNSGYDGIELTTCLNQQLISLIFLLF